MTEPTETPELMTANEVADLMHTSPQAVRRWGDQGWLPAMRLPSGHLRFPRDAVLKHLGQVKADVKRKL